MSKKNNILHQLLEQTDIIYSFCPILKFTSQCSFTLLLYFKFVTPFSHLLLCKMCVNISGVVFKIILFYSFYEYNITKISLSSTSLFYLLLPKEINSKIYPLLSPKQKVNKIIV